MSAEIIQTVQTVTTADATWFACHPGRTVRVRPFVEGEAEVSMPYGDGVRAVIVRQIHPGVRARVPAYLPKMPPDTEKASLALLRHIMGRQA